MGEPTHAVRLTDVLLLLAMGALLVVYALLVLYAVRGYKRFLNHYERPPVADTVHRTIPPDKIKGWDLLTPERVFYYIDTIPKAFIVLFVIGSIAFFFTGVIIEVARTWSLYALLQTLVLCIAFYALLWVLAFGGVIVARAWTLIRGECPWR